ncbi:NEW3 domain-containing protein [Propionimicrobium sp. PCR01-08-3]|uniref:golvesin C-terminal-like domain-containing protein n=1 Tax=Propionimicrobium sp. PCR01-08-3 TaxID=3052086 RepID=UPI00255D045A|nr:NEW3 domain-containing protein [Propionimicrobium sp. PCR01-08-3]WIY81713.1 NEW3 domain-containing protein [Propionimicrobium sp. PCR01-08-3]
MTTETHDTNSPRLKRRTMLQSLLVAGVLPPIASAAIGADIPASAAPETSAGGYPDALRRLDKPNLQLKQIAQLTGPNHRMTFYQATWDGGATVVRDLEVAYNGGWLLLTDPEHRFDEQWAVFTGTLPSGSAPELYGPLAVSWLGFTSYRKIGKKAIELITGTDDVGLTVRWQLEGDNPEAHYVLTAKNDGDYLVGYQSQDTKSIDDLDEVLCGTYQHALTVREGSAPLGAWELFAPMSLTQYNANDVAVTTGVFLPADVAEFVHERQLMSDQQPYGMSLRNDSLDVVPCMYSPQPGLRTAMKDGDRRGFAFGIAARVDTLYGTYAELCRDEYGLTAYRENVYDRSLTDAIHAMIDLIEIEPEGDDSVDYIPSFSGWWNRAKGFVDVENENAVRTAASGVLLSASYLTDTGDGALYERRARPLIEYQLSRKGIGHTPIIGYPVYTDKTQYRIGRIPTDSVNLTSLYQLTHGRNAALERLAVRANRDGVVGQSRAPFANALATYRITGDPAYLAEAKLLGSRYVRDEILTPYRGNGQPPTGFAYSFSKYWVDLLELFEVTGEQEYLDGAYREVQRFITQTEVRPIPNNQVTVPIGHVVTQQYDWKSRSALPDYPVDSVSEETVPAWYVSTTGLTFEALSSLMLGTSDVTDPGGGYVFNPCWAGALLRLAQHTGDPLIADVAHNMVIGRFTTYPGYYSRQFQVAQMKPDFATSGPPQITGYYFHHAPAQLGLAMDYLFSESYYRSGGAIDFPHVFEADFAYFKFFDYGHAPGTFFGEDGVWPYLPAGLIAVDNPQINWLGATGNGSLYISLTNSAVSDQHVNVELASEVSGLDRSAREVEVIAADGSRFTDTAHNGKLGVKVPGHGLVALIVRNVDVNRPALPFDDIADRGTDSFSEVDTDPGSDYGLVRGLLLVRPDSRGYDAYIQIDTEQQASLNYRIGDQEMQQAAAKQYPFEWTIPVDNLTQTFSYTVTFGETTTDEVTLRLPGRISGQNPGVAGDVIAQATSTPGDEVPLTFEVRNASDAAISGTVSVTVPAGWAVAGDGLQISVGAEDSARVETSATVPADAELGEVEVTATLEIPDSEPVVLRPALVQIMNPRRMVSLVTDTAVVSGPGATANLTTVVINTGVVPLQGTLALYGTPGWTIANQSVNVTIPPRSDLAQTWTITAGPNVALGTAHRFEARLDQTLRKGVMVRVADEGIIASTQSPWPGYVEASNWYPSGLAGWNGTSTRYSAEDSVGATATWTVTLPDAGLYRVSVWYPTNPDTTTSAAYIVEHQGGSSEVIVDQTQNAAEWFSLGEYRYDANSQGVVRLEVRSEIYHRASAAQFIRVGD